jgi:hypothetical protein
MFHDFVVNDVERDGNDAFETDWATATAGDHWAGAAARGLSTNLI